MANFNADYAAEIFPGHEPDPSSVSYQHGYEQGFKGREFRNPGAGNRISTANHYFGFCQGEHDRAEVSA